MDTILITGLTDNGTNIILIPNRAIINTNLANGEMYNLRLACGMRGLASSTLPILIQTSSANIPLLDRFGNTVLPNQLFTRRNYKVGFGRGNTTVYGSGQLVMQCNLCIGCTATTSNTSKKVN